MNQQLLLPRRIRCQTERLRLLLLVDELFRRVQVPVEDVIDVGLVLDERKVPRLFAP